MPTVFAAFRSWMLLLSKKRVRPDRRLSIQFVQHEEGGMETYKIMWVPSTSDFVESRDVVGKIDSGAEFVVAGGLASSANEVTYDFPTGSLVEVWTRVYGDNNTQADSNHASFNASNQEGVKADTGLSVLWVGHKS